MIEHLTLEIFKDKIMDFETNTFKNEKPIVIKFSATWCSPCKSYTPIYDNVSKEIEDVNFYSVDVEEESEISNLFSVRSVPTTILINNAGEKKSFSGLISKERLETTVKQFLL